MQTLRQIEFALFDMLLHTEHDPAQDFMPLLTRVRSEVAVLQPPAFSRTRTPSATSLPGYAAGYYSYKWAEVLSADACRSRKPPNPTAATTRHGPKIPRNHPRSRWQPPGHGILQRPSGAANQPGRVAAPPGHGMIKKLAALSPIAGFQALCMPNARE